MLFGRLARLVAASTLTSLVLMSVGTVTTGQTTEPAKGKAKVKARVKAKAEAPAAPAAPLDLNTASTEAMIDALPGVGEATAKKIVAGRPYTKVDDLARAGVPARVIEGIRSMVTVSAPPAPAEAPTPAPARPKVAKAKERIKAAEAPAAPAANATVPPASAPTAATVPAKTKSRTAKAAPPRLAAGQRVNLNKATKEELELLPGIGPVKSQAIIEGRPFKTIEDVMKVKGIKEGEFSKIKDVITVN